jgi:hypothetical protein
MWTVYNLSSSSFLMEYLFPFITELFELIFQFLNKLATLKIFFLDS